MKNKGQTIVEQLLIIVTIVVIISVLGRAAEKRFPGTLTTVREAVNALGEEALHGVTSGRDTP